MAFSRLGSCRAIATEEKAFLKRTRIRFVLSNFILIISLPINPLTETS